MRMREYVGIALICVAAAVVGAVPAEAWRVGSGFGYLTIPSNDGLFVPDGGSVSTLDFIVAPESSARPLSFGAAFAGYRVTFDVPRGGSGSLLSGFERGAAASLVWSVETLAIYGGYRIPLTDAAHAPELELDIGAAVARVKLTGTVRNDDTAFGPYVGATLWIPLNLWRLGLYARGGKSFAEVRIGATDVSVGPSVIATGLYLREGRTDVALPIPEDVTGPVQQGVDGSTSSRVIRFAIVSGVLIGTVLILVASQ